MRSVWQPPAGQPTRVRAWCSRASDGWRPSTSMASHRGGPTVRPMGTVVSPDGTLLFATTGRGKNVLFIDTKTNKPLGSVEAGDRPWGIAVSSDGRTVFTANGPSNDVTFIDVASRMVTAKVKAGERPWGVVYVP